MMQKRIMFVSGSVWEAELLIQRYSSITNIPWEDQKTFLYSQPRVFAGIQSIFVVTGYDASHAKKALHDAFDKFQKIDFVIGHGFCSGLVKHCEAGDPVLVKELLLASYPEILTPPQTHLQDILPSPIWTKCLALKKTFSNEIEKAAVYASSNMEVMDPICGVWHKVMTQKGISFSIIKAILDGGNEIGMDFYMYLNAKGQFERLQTIKNTFKKPMSGLGLHYLKKNKAKELTSKSHQLIQSICVHMAKQTSEMLEDTSNRESTFMRA